MRITCSETRNRSEESSVLNMISIEIEMLLCYLNLDFFGIFGPLSVVS